MGIISNRIVTYSLLAHINDHNQGIRDLCDLYVPLVKKVLSDMSNEGISKGAHINEIKQRVDKLFYLDIPFPLLEKIIIKISKEVESKKDSSFILYKDQSFSINNYTFSEFEEEINQEENNIEKIEELYKTYLELNEIRNNKVSLFEFIDKNRAQLIGYFSDNKSSESFDKDFSIQANFINSIKSDKNLYKIICKIYLGSIIVSYLEFEPKPDSGKVDKEFLLDTNFVIGLLDLNTIESTHTCRKITEICKRLKYRLTVLDLTIEETRNLLERTANNLSTTFLQKKIDPESIYNACDRRKLSKTDLEKISTNLQYILRDEFSISIVYDSTKFQNEAKYSKEYEIYKEVRSTEWSALHDATVIKYVQKKRVGNSIDYFSTSCFFVTNTGRHSKPLLDSNSVPETIRAEDLVNILWLTNPNVKLNLKNSEVIDIGLSRLISSTLNSKLPSSRIIKELDSNIQKYAKDSISDQDIIRVANRIANKTILHLDELNRLADESPKAFVERLNDEARKEEEKERKFKESLRTLLVEIRESTKEKAKAEVSESKREYLEELNKVKSESDVKIASIIETQNVAIQNTLEENYIRLKNIKNSYDVISSKKAAIFLGWLIIPPLLALLYVYVYGDDKLSEKLFTIATIIYFIITYFFFVITKKEWSLKAIFESLAERNRKKFYKKFNFDLDYFLQLEKKIKL